MPMFSVVMPTRNRAKTLRHALQTAINQDFDDYEVVVIDNYSQDDTAEVAQQAGVPHVRYVRTPEPLHMCKNWDFGLAQARGQYSIILSDDDGLLPNALSEAARLVQEAGVKVVQWHRVQYNWPGYLLGDQENCLIYTRPRYAGRVESARKILYDAVRLMSTNDTPGLVNSVIHADVFTEIRSRTGGRAIVAHAPDVSSGLIVPAVVNEIYVHDQVIGVAGLSEFSTGVSLHADGGTNKIGQEFRKSTVELGEYTTTFVNRHGFSTSSCMLDSLHDAYGHIPEVCDLQEVDYVAYAAQSVYELSQFSRRSSKRALAKDLLKMVKQEYGLWAALRFKALVAKGDAVRLVNTEAMRPLSSVLRKLLEKPYGSREIYWGDEHGFHNIDEACRFLHARLTGAVDCSPRTAEAGA